MHPEQIDSENISGISDVHLRLSGQLTGKQPREVENSCRDSIGHLTRKASQADRLNSPQRFAKDALSSVSDRISRENSKTDALLSN